MNEGVAVHLNAVKVCVKAACEPREKHSKLPAWGGWGEAESGRKFGDRDLGQMEGWQPGREEYGRDVGKGHPPKMRSSWSSSM